MKEFLDENGNQVSMSQFARDKFMSGMTRREIADEFEIPYRTVYGATLNMTNGVEDTTKRTTVNPILYVTGNGEVYENKESVPEDVEVREIDRKSYIVELANAGELSRGEIAKKVNCSYGVVYGLTKDLFDAVKRDTKIKVIDENGEEIEMDRAEYIRQQVAKGVKKSEIAKELNCSYNVVWQATKKEKTFEEKVQSHIDALNKLTDEIVPEKKEEFVTTIQHLGELIQ